ncbi:hypothetical protein ACTXG6_35175 [Pseudonocardia sp. Cha107L01]|uniref:hypothetical protein n=1 Tax=Pseudonocardia sp. Cha107L01 TaxID=3457576 RepID=UPI00403E5C97
MTVTPVNNAQPGHEVSWALDDRSGCELLAIRDHEASFEVRRLLEFSFSCSKLLALLYF